MKQRGSRGVVQGAGQCGAKTAVGGQGSGCGINSELWWGVEKEPQLPSSYCLVLKSKTNGFFPPMLNGENSLCLGFR